MVQNLLNGFFSGDFHLALVIMDALGALWIVYLTQALTKHACFTGSAQQKWAMVRRAILLLAAFCLFAKGVWRTEKPQMVDWVEFLTQLGIIFALLVFPLLRYLDVITQDEPTHHRAG
jgi:hypothetical protein